MSLTGLTPAGKAILRLRPKTNEGLYIKYQLALRGNTFARVSAVTGTTLVSVSNVVFGRRRSARIEAEIARILEKPSWNDVVTEARAATGRLPVPTRPRQEKRRAG